MKDEEIKIEEIESSHTLGGAGSVTLLSYTLKYISLSYVGILCQILSVSLNGGGGWLRDGRRFGKTKLYQCKRDIFPFGLFTFSQNKKRRGSWKGKCHTKTMMRTKTNESLR